MQQNERNASRTRSPRGKSPSGRMSRLPCKDYLKGTCTNSFCEKWHPPECLFYKSKNGCRFGEKCSFAHRQVDAQPSKRSGSRVHHNTELWTHLMVSRWNSSGIFSQDSPHCSSATKSKSSRLKGAIHQNSKDGSSSCQCSMTSHGDLKTMNGNAMLTPTSFLFVQEDSQQDDGHSSNLDPKRSGILLMLTDHKDNGTESLN